MFLCCASGVLDVLGERRLDVGGAIVDRDHERAARKRPVPVVEREHFDGRERAETEPAQQPEVGGETARVEIDALLSCLAVAGEPVVDECAVRGRESSPLVSRRGCPRTRPERAVGGGSHERGVAARWQGDAPREAMAEPGLTPRSQLELGHEGRVGPEDLDRVAAACPAQFEQLVIARTSWIVGELKKLHPDTPVIGFPKGAGGKLRAYASETGVDAIGLDETVDPSWAARECSG